MSRAVIAEKATHAGERAREMLDNGGSVVTRARSLVSGDAQFFSANPKVDQIRKELESDSIQDKKDAMKRVIAQICKGNDMSALFPDVVKNILIQSIELRKLIYYFIVHYAEDRPNEALLSISAFQKDLVDSSMHVRSLALRMLSSIRIPAIQPVVMLAVKKCSSDMAWIVRKTSAISLSQMNNVSGNDGENTDVFADIIGQLLGDKNPDVQGAAALSMMEICSSRVDLIHRHFRRLCRSIVEADEFAQTVLLHVLLRYARTQFLDPNRPAPKKEVVKKAEGESSSDSSDEDIPARRNELQEDLKMDPDHRLLLTSVKPLLLSMNRAVVIGAASLFFHIAPIQELDLCVKPLIRLLGGPAEGHAIVLSAIHTFVLSRPGPFTNHIKEFFINNEDNNQVRELKIRIVAKLALPINFTPVIHEFRSYLRSFDVTKVLHAIKGLGLLSSAVPDSSTPIMRLITPMLSHKHPDVVTESVVVLRQLVVQGSDPAQTCRIVHKLLQQVIAGEIKAAAARASILWLVGENINVHPAIAAAAPDCFRVFAKSFVKEDPTVKKQVLMLGSKIWLHLDGEGALADRFKKMFFYVLELVRFDTDYELRDRGRIIQCSLDRQSATFSSLKAAMLAPKPLPQQNDPFLEKAKYQLGSLSHLFGNGLLGYEELPAWPEVQPDPTARDPPMQVRSPSSESSDYSDYSDYSEDENTDSSSEASSSAASSSSSGRSSSSGSSSDSDSSSSDSSGAARRVAAKNKKASPAKKAPAPVAIKKAIVITRVGAPKPAAVAPVAAAPAPEPEEEKAEEPKEEEPEEKEEAVQEDEEQVAAEDDEAAAEGAEVVEGEADSDKAEEEKAEEEEED